MDIFTTEREKARMSILSEAMCRISIESTQNHGNTPVLHESLVDNFRQYSNVKFEDLLKETNEEKIKRCVLFNPEFQTAKFFLETCKNRNLTRNNKYLLHCMVSFLNAMEIPIEEIYDLIVDNFLVKRYFIIEVCLKKWLDLFLPEQLYFFLKKLERLIDINELGGTGGTYIKNCCKLIISSEKISPNYNYGLLLELAIELGLNSSLERLIFRPLARLNQISYVCTDKHISCDIRYGELKIAFCCDNIEAGEILMKKILLENPGMRIEQMMPCLSKGQSTLDSPIHWEEYQKSFRRFLVMCQNA
jgi:hypothetical protein